MNYINQTIQIYLDDLAAKKPAPGGGSVAALVAALAAGLLSMVVNYTLGKDPSKDAKIRALLAKSESLRKSFMDLIDLDVSAYSEVSAAKKKSEDDYQKALKNATEVPLKVCVLSAEGLKLCEKFYPDANKYLLSDLDIAMKLFKSALSSAMFNVKINLPYIKDREYLEKIEKQMFNLEEDE
jgi:glutamate formiminotransferase/formiminotetrahydrofolate cyclodeaminase